MIKFNDIVKFKSYIIFKNEKKEVIIEDMPSFKTKADENNLAYVDMYAFFKKINNGFPHNGVTYSSEFLKGQFFSLDGITPTGRGSALIANEFIKAINEKYQTRIPQTDANSFPGILFP